MLVAIGFHAGDLDQAERLAEQMREFGPYPNHRLLVARDRSTPVQPFANVGFGSVEEIIITDDAWHAWPQSANNVFRKLAKHVQYTKPEPWLYLEPDCALIRKGWLDEIAKAYADARKPFMGFFVGQNKDVPDHISGIAVYPGELPRYGAGNATIAVDVPFDIIAAAEIRRQAHFTHLIQHAWKHKPFESLDEIPAGCVLFHADKAGSITKLLRKGREAVNPPAQSDGVETSGVAPDPAGRPSADNAGSNPAPCTPPLTHSMLEKVHEKLQDFDKEAVKQLVASALDGPILTTLDKTTFLGVTPWTSRVESIEEIKQLVGRLKEFCTAPKHVEFVRQQLVHQRVLMPKHIKPKKRRYRRKQAV